MSYEAIIWDCDGVLIDSEALACGAEVKSLNEMGYDISLEDFLLKFIGKSYEQVVAEVKEEIGVDVSEKMSAEKSYSEIKPVFEKHLKAMPGVKNVLERLDLPMAVASGSGLDRLNDTLGMTSLLDYFDGHVYSAEMVENGKPAPDVFLLAAEKLGVNPENCLVIEDGLHGINGAKAAGMDVFLYVGGSHITESLKEKFLKAEVNAVLNHMDELLPIIEAPAKKAG